MADETDEDLADTIKETAEAPKKIVVGDQTIESHDLQSLIEADKYLRSKGNAANRPFGRRLKFIPPGAV